MQREDIQNLLPAVFRRAATSGNAIVGALLDVMEALHERPEHILKTLDVCFDPRRAPDELVPYLGRWVDLDRFYDQSFKGQSTDAQEPISTGVGALRELIHSAAYLSKWRGTRKGLQAFLEIATQVPGFVVSDASVGGEGHLKPFHILVRIPPDARPHGALIERIIQSEKPAYVTYETEFASVAEGT
ncbi:MAG: phage tail protein [Betaproteobacteria bacterium]